MPFHNALQLVFATFSRQVLQQGNLTAYLADCGVFETFDDRRTICLTIDCYYGARLYACLCSSPYKATFDSIAEEVKRRHPNIDPAIVDYVFQSIRFAWGKIGSVKEPKTTMLFSPPKRPRRLVRHTKPSKGPTQVVRRRRLNKVKRRMRTPSVPKKQPNIAPPTASQRSVQHHSNQIRISQVVIYILVLIYIFAASVMLLSHHTTLAIIMFAIIIVLLYIRIKFL